MAAIMKVVYKDKPIYTAIVIISSLPSSGSSTFQQFQRKESAGAVGKQCRENRIKVR